MQIGRSKALATHSFAVVVATDAPMDARNLKHLAARALLGLGRTGSAGSNGSGRLRDRVFDRASGAHPTAGHVTTADRGVVE